MPVLWPVEIKCDNCDATAPAQVRMTGYGETKAVPYGLNFGFSHEPCFDLLIAPGSTWGWVERLLSCSPPCAEALAARLADKRAKEREEMKKPINFFAKTPT